MVDTPNKSTRQYPRAPFWESAAVVLYAIGAVALFALGAYQLWSAGSYAKLGLFLVLGIITLALLLLLIRRPTPGPAIVAAGLLGAAWALAFKW